VRDVSHLVAQRLPAPTPDELLNLGAKYLGNEHDNAAEAEYAARLEYWAIGATTVSVDPNHPGYFRISCHGRYPTSDEIIVAAERFLPGGNQLVASPSSYSPMGGRYFLYVELDESAPAA
jgi:hypothetical protein